MSGALVLAVPLSEINHSSGEAFEFYFKTPNSGAYGGYEQSPRLKHDPASPGLAFAPGETGRAAWYDLSGNSITADYDLGACRKQATTGVLLIHHHNALENQGEVVRIPAIAPVLNARPASFAVPALTGYNVIEITNSGETPLFWSASVAGGADWITLGTRENSADFARLQFRWDTNTGEARTGAIRIQCEAATNSPVDITVNQAADETPVLSVDPKFVRVPNQAGSVTTAVTNKGRGRLDWSATVDSASAWLSSNPHVTGDNGAGEADITFNANTSTAERTGLVQIAASGAKESPAWIKITQAGRLANAFATTPEKIILPAGGGTRTISVIITGEEEITWNAAVLETSADWITIERILGPDDISGVINLTAEPGPKSGREATIIITAGAGEPVAEIPVRQQGRFLGLGCHSGQNAPRRTPWSILLFFVLLAGLSFRPEKNRNRT
jgi:hypothetical protein